MNIKEAFEYIRTNPGAQCWVVPRMGAGITWDPEGDQPAWSTSEGKPSCTLVTVLTKDIFSEWVVEDAPKQPEFVDGGPALKRFPWAFMFPVVDKLLETGMNVWVAGWSAWDHVRPPGDRYVRWFPRLCQAGNLAADAQHGALVVESDDWHRLPYERQKELLKSFKRVVVVRPAQTEGEVA